MWPEEIWKLWKIEIQGAEEPTLRDSSRRLLQNWERHMSKLKGYAKSGRKDFLHGVRNREKRSASGRLVTFFAADSKKKRDGMRRREDVRGKEWTKKIRAGTRGPRSYVGGLDAVGCRSFRDTDRFFSPQHTRAAPSGFSFRIKRRMPSKRGGPAQTTDVRTAPAATLARQKNIPRKTFANNGQLSGIVTRAKSPVFFLRDSLGHEDLMRQILYSAFF